MDGQVKKIYMESITDLNDIIYGTTFVTEQTLGIKCQRKKNRVGLIQTNI